MRLLARCSPTAQHVGSLFQMQSSQTRSVHEMICVSTHTKGSRQAANCCVPREVMRSKHNCAVSLA